jgi:hypothetical protein
MSDAKPTDRSEIKLPDRIRFHYLKSPQFGTVHADGAIGGLTPRGGLHIAFYAERMPIPTMTEQPLKSDGTLGEENLSARVVRDGVIRELSVDVMMDLATAATLHRWLGDKLREARELSGAASAATGEQGASDVKDGEPK